MYIWWQIFVEVFISCFDTIHKSTYNNWFTVKRHSRKSFLSPFFQWLFPLLFLTQVFNHTYSDITFNFNNQEPLLAFLPISSYLERSSLWYIIIVSYHGTYWLVFVVTFSHFSAISWLPGWLGKEFQDKYNKLIGGWKL